MLLSKTKLHSHWNNNPFYFGKQHLGAGQGGAEKRIQNCYNISVSLINLTGKLVAERREREKKNERTKTKSREGKSFVYVCTRGWASFLVARGRVRVCKNETLKWGKLSACRKIVIIFRCFRLPRKANFPLFSITEINNNAPNQRTRLIVINGRPRFPLPPKKIHDNAIFIKIRVLKGNPVISLSFRDLLKFNTMESESEVLSIFLSNLIKN